MRPFTTVSGSAATNNLVLSAVQDVGSAVTVKIVNGLVTYFNANGDYVSTGYGLSAFASSGIPLSTATVTNATSVGTDLATFQTTGFVSKANKPGPGITFIDAVGNTSAQIDAFIANHVGAAANSLINTTLNIGQYTLLNGTVTGTNYLGATSTGVIYLDATGASADQVLQVVADSNAAGASNLASGSVNNIVLSADQFDGVAHIAYAKLAAGGADVNALDAAAGTGAGNTTETLITAVNANASKVGDVWNVRATADNINAASFAPFATQLTANGVISVAANTALTALAVTGGTGFTVGDTIAFVGGNGVQATATVASIGNGGAIATITPVGFGSGYTTVPTAITAVTGTGNPAGAVLTGTSVGSGQITSGAWNTIIANASLFADGSIGATGAVDVSQLSVAKFLQVANEFATNSAGQVGVGLDLYGASATQINNVITNIAKLASGTVEEANVTSTQFAALASKIAAGEATVNAGSASAAEVTAILNNLTKFDNTQSTDGVAHTASYLTLNAAQINSLANLTALTAATPVSSVGALNVVAVDSATAMNLNLSTFTNAITGMGSNTADTVTFGGKATFNGAQGADVITGSNTASSLSGGNGADTITGGSGNDTITGGKAGAAGGFNVLTGGAGNDFFLMNLNNPQAGDLSINKVTDLGRDADKLQVDTGVVATAYVYQNGGGTGFTAAAGGALNNGTTTIKNYTYNIANNTEAAAATNAVINLQNATGTAGFSVVGGSGNDDITGSLQGDTIVGGSGNDTITGLSGADSLTGGAGVDTFNVSGSGTDVITDLGAGGQDVLVVSVGASVAAAVTTTWDATAATSNAGTATLTLANSIGINLDNVNSGNGYTITAAGNSAGSYITASLGADTITGSNGTDFIAGMEGIDQIALGTDASQDVVDLIAVANTANRDYITGFVAGVGGDVLQGQTALFDVYLAADAEVTATVATLALLGAGAANNKVGSATVNYIVADTANNILSSNLSTQFAGSNGVMAYATDTGNVYYDLDGNFTSGAVLIANVAANGTLTADNFSIV